MGLSKLSEKCQKCNHKNTCDNKQMEACAYMTVPLIPKMKTSQCTFSEPIIGGMLNSGIVCVDSGVELIGKINSNGEYSGNSELIVEAIRKAIESEAKKGRCIHA